MSDNNGGSLIGWNRSPDGGDSNTVPLNTDSSKYTVTTNENTGITTLTIINLNGTDEGLYNCVYERGEVGNRCIFVYGEFGM